MASRSRGVKVRRGGGRYVNSGRVFNIDNPAHRKALNVVVARMASRQTGTIRHVAKSVEMHAKVIAAAHHYSGQYEMGVHSRPLVTRQGVVDWVVTVDRDVVGHIEFGHFAGPRVSRKRKFAGGRKWVPGIHALHAAALRVAGR